MLRREPPGEPKAPLLEGDYTKKGNLSMNNPSGSLASPTGSGYCKNGKGWYSDLEHRIRKACCLLRTAALCSIARAGLPFFSGPQLAPGYFTGWLGIPACGW